MAYIVPKIPLNPRVWMDLDPAHDETPLSIAGVGRTPLTGQLPHDLRWRRVRDGRKLFSERRCGLYGVS